MNLDQSFGDQLRDHLMRGIGIDFECLAESAHGREGIPRPHLPRDHRFAGSINHLLVKRHARLKRYTERN
jgi:hypothetical protein